RLTTYPPTTLARDRSPRPTGRPGSAAEPRPPAGVDSISSHNTSRIPPTCYSSAHLTVATPQARRAVFRQLTCDLHILACRGRGSDRPRHLLLAAGMCGLWQRVPGGRLTTLFQGLERSGGNFLSSGASLGRILLVIERRLDGEIVGDSDVNDATPTRNFFAIARNYGRVVRVASNLYGLQEVNRPRLLGSVDSP